MKPTKLDYSVIDKLGLELSPIGVYYDLFKPTDIEPMDYSIEKSLCEILRYAQEVNKSFYFTKDHKETCIGKIILGMDQFPPSAESGQIGERLGVFNAPRCNGRLYQSVRKIPFGTANYISFVPYKEIKKDPDVLIFAGPADKLEPVLRAATYSTGINYKSECTPVMGCSWFFAYPFLTGDINFIVPAFVHGPHGRKLYSSDTVLVSVPYQWVPTVINNLGEMPLHLSGHESKEAYYSEFEGILSDLAEETANI